MSDEAEIHDTSRIDAFMAARRRAMVLNAVWKPALAGAAGAALVIAAVWVVLPKISVREVVVDRVTQRAVSFDSYVPETRTFDNAVPVNKDVSVPNVVVRDVPVEVPKVVVKNVDVPVERLVPHDVPFDRFVPHDVQVDIPRIVSTPPPTAPMTPAEQSFVSSPEYENALYRGRVVVSRGHGALSFDDGKDFYPAHRDPATSQSVYDSDRAFDTGRFVGDFAMCRQDPDDSLWSCSALHNGVVTPILHRRGHPA